MLLGYISKRLLQLIPLLVAVSIIIFVIIQIPPGDYLTMYKQQLELSGTAVNEAAIIALEKRYALDKPMHIQYLTWVKNIITKGDFCRSMAWDKPVTEVFKGRIGITILISFLTLILVWIVSIPIGIFSATHQYSTTDYIVSFLGFIGQSVPGFLIALFFIYLIFVNTGVAFTGLNSPEFVQAPMSMAKFLNMLPRMGLAIVVIGLSQTAGMIRTMRAMMLDELQKQYVVTARSKGLKERKLLFKYPIRIALNPMVSTIGWVLPALIGGEIIVSKVLNMPTMGPILIKALQGQDMYLAGSFVLIISVLTVIGTLISDVLLALIDPRIKFGGATEG